MRRVLFLVAASLLAQPALQFEVASIRPSPPITPELVQAGLPIGMRIVGDRVTIGFVTMSGLIQWAYNVKDYQVTGPSWMEEQRFNIDATLPPGAGREQFPALLRELLKERFRLKVRQEQREASVYVLTQSVSGIRAKPASIPQPTAEVGGVIPTQMTNTGGAEVFTSERGSLRRTSGPNGMHVEWDRLSLSDYAETLASALSTPVVDRTGLSGVFQLSIDYPPQGAQNDLSTTVLESVRSLGLRLERAKIPLEHVVVESVERTPSEN